VHTGLVAFGLRQVSPDFFGGEDEHGSDESHQRASNFPDHRLCGAARFVRGSFRIEAVFQHIEIKGAEIHDAEIMDGVIDAVEIIRGVPVAAFGDQLGGALEHPAIHFLELIVGERVVCRIEIGQIAERDATQRRSRSAPQRSTISLGYRALPRDLDMGWPFSSRVQP